MNQLASKLQFGLYNGIADPEFNESLFNSLVSQYADYTDQNNAINIVRSFMPVSTIVDVQSSYEQRYSLVAYIDQEVVALTCITPFRDSYALYIETAYKFAEHISYCRFEHRREPGQYTAYHI